MKAFLLLLALALTTGCARLETKVTRFHQLPNVSPGKTFTLSGPKKRAHRLEYDKYASLIAARLSAHGWRYTHSAQSDYVATFDCGILGTRDAYDVVPVMGYSGGEAVFQTGAVYNRHGKYRGSYSGVGYSMPVYGVVGSAAAPVTVFDRFLTLTITDRRTGKTVFESRAISSGESGEINEVLPAMIDALFQDFPGPSGATRVYQTPLQRP